MCDVIHDLIPFCCHLVWYMDFIPIFYDLIPLFFFCYLLWYMDSLFFIWCDTWILLWNIFCNIQMTTVRSVVDESEFENNVWVIMSIGFVHFNDLFILVVSMVYLLVIIFRLHYNILVEQSIWGLLITC